MEFIDTKLEGAFLISLSRIEDNRGYFARGWCQEEFSRHGLIGGMVQLNVGFSHEMGTLRGMHYQRPPHQEAKLARCTRGAIFDVIVDLRSGSSTYKQWFGAELTAPMGGCYTFLRVVPTDIRRWPMTRRCTIDIGCLCGFLGNRGALQRFCLRNRVAAGGDGHFRGGCSVAGLRACLLSSRPLGCHWIVQHVNRQFRLDPMSMEEWDQSGSRDQTNEFRAGLTAPRRDKKDNRRRQ